MSVALSIRQPWAWLIVHRYKDVENRTWPTTRRGRFLVHAGKTFDREGYEFVRMEFPQIDMPARGSFELGGIVGEAKIVDCIEKWPEDDDHDSIWFHGPFGFVLEDARPLPFQACRGKLGFFRVRAA